jgi:hypothetical protein
MSVAAPVIRLYESLGLTFPEEAQMPPGATAEIPPCLLCNLHSRLPPSKVGFISVGEAERLFQICAVCNCDCPDEAELEARILAKVSGAPKVDISQPPIAAAGQPAWATRAAQAWAKPLTARQKPAA